MNSNTSKFSMVFLGGFAIKGVSLFRSCASSQMNSLPLNADYCSEASIFPDHTLESRCVIALLGAVITVLCLGHNSEIFASIVESFMIYMIALTLVTSFKIEDLAMHTNRSPSSIFKLFISCCIEVIGPGIPERKPSIFCQPFEVRFVNNGHLAEGKRDLFHAPIIRVL